MRNKYLILFVIILCAAGCITINKLGVTNLEYLYRSESNFADMEAKAHHISGEKTRVYYRLNLSGLLYEKPEGKQRFMANFMIHFDLYESFTQGALIDSGSFIFSDSSYYGEYYLFHSAFDVHTVYPGEFVLNIELKDLNRDKSYIMYLEVFKLSEYSSQNFLLVDEKGDVMYDDHPEAYDMFRLKYMKNIDTTLYVRYYSREFPIAVPPFLEDERKSFSYKADSVFEVTMSDGSTSDIYLKNKGFYHFQVDTSIRDGYTVFRYYRGFPEVNSPEIMLPPVRYITTRREFDELIAYPDVKQAVDDFWLGNTGNPGRARSMIRNFYTRVQEANSYFSSYHEGWKTDRGMIYIVYGPPNIVYKEKNFEKWIYGEEGNLMSITFNFVKVNNPFTNNDYVVDKSPGYKEAWYLGVDNWRR